MGRLSFIGFEGQPASKNNPFKQTDGVRQRSLLLLLLSLAARQQQQQQPRPSWCVSIYKIHYQSTADTAIHYILDVIYERVTPVHPPSERPAPRRRKDGNNTKTFRRRRRRSRPPTHTRPRLFIKDSRVLLISLPFPLATSPRCCRLFRRPQRYIYVYNWKKECRRHGNRRHLFFFLYSLNASFITARGSKPGKQQWRNVGFFFFETKKINRLMRVMADDVVMSACGAQIKHTDINTELRGAAPARISSGRTMSQFFEKERKGNSAAVQRFADVIASRNSPEIAIECCRFLRA